MSLKRNYSKKLSKTIALAVMAMSVAGFASVASAEEPVATIFGSSATIEGQYTAASETAQITNPFDKEEMIDVKKATITASSDLTVNSATALNGDKFYSTTVDMGNNALTVNGNDNGIVVGVDCTNWENIKPTNFTISNLKSLDLVKEKTESAFEVRDVGMAHDVSKNVGIGAYSVISTSLGWGAENNPTYAAIADIKTTGNVNIKNYAVGIAFRTSGVNKGVDDRASKITINAEGDINFVGNKNNNKAQNADYISQYGSIGIYAKGCGGSEDKSGDVKLISGGNINVTGYELPLTVDGGSSINLKAKNNIVLDGLGRYGIYANNGTIELNSEEGNIDISGINYGIFIDAKSNRSAINNVTINGDAKIKTDEYGVGITMLNSNNNSVTINGNTIIESDRAAHISSGSLLEIYGNLVAKDINKGFNIDSTASLIIDGIAVIEAEDALNIMNNATGMLNLKDGSNIDGNINVAIDSSLDITMSNSQLKGNIEIDETSSMSYKLSNDSTLRGTINTKKVEYGSKEEMLDRYAEEDGGYSSFKELLEDWYCTPSVQEAMDMCGYETIEEFCRIEFGLDVSKAGTSEKGKLDLTLGKGSVLEGAATGDGDINFTLKDGATWNVTGDSEIATLAGADGVIKPGDYTVTTKAAAEGTSVNVVGEEDLNSIANKIYYTNYVNGEKNLSAKAVIEGEAARESAEMLFKDDNGQGYINEQEATDTEIFGEFNESINKNTNVTVAETGVWAPTGESSVPSLKGEAGSAINMSNADSLNVENYSGETTMLYGHEESDPTKIIGGDVNIGKAEEGSKVTMSTDNKGINTEDNKQVAAVMNAMAQKLTYAEAAENPAAAPVNNLSGKVQIAEGLTASSASIAAGDIKFDKDGKGTVDESTIENKAQKGDTETATMKAVKGALVDGVLMMRAESNDLLKRMGDVRLAEEDRGLWAKYYGGKYEMDKANAHVSYKAYQLGYDTKAGKNWTVGGAVSYNEGKDGRTELKNTAVGVYGTWTDDKGQYIDLITKIGWLKNDFDVKAAGHDIDDSLKTTGMSLSAEYGKRFENKNGFFLDPSAELTFGHLIGKKVNAKADGGSTTLGIDQDDFNSLVGRLGIRIGQKSAKSSVYAKVALAHEFCGDFDVTFSAPSEPTKKVSVDLKDTWGEFQIGGTTKVGKAGLLYANYQRSFAGDVKEKYRVDAGLRWSF